LNVIQELVSFRTHLAPGSHRLVAQLAIWLLALWISNGLVAIPVTVIDPPHGMASPAVPALFGSGYHSKVESVICLFWVAKSSGSDRFHFGNILKLLAREMLWPYQDEKMREAPIADLRPAGMPDIVCTKNEAPRKRKEEHHG
jgi:hypothetical protein